MPTLDYYTNDALVILSNTASVAHVIFLFYHVMAIRSVLTIFPKDNDNPSPDIAPFVVLFLPLMNAWSLACAIFCNIAAFTFFMAGSLLDVTSYGSNGFVYGLLDNGNPSRQWYYITGLILVIANFFLFVGYETKIRPELYKRSGVGLFGDSIYTSIAEHTEKSVKKIKTGLKKLVP